MCACVSVCVCVWVCVEEAGFNLIRIIHCHPTSTMAIMLSLSHRRTIGWTRQKVQQNQVHNSFDIWSFGYIHKCLTFVCNGNQLFCDILFMYLYISLWLVHANAAPSTYNHIKWHPLAAYVVFRVMNTEAIMVWNLISKLQNPSLQEISLKEMNVVSI